MQHRDGTGFQNGGQTQRLPALVHAQHLRKLPALTDSDGKAWTRRRQRFLLGGEALAYHGARPPLRPPQPGRRGPRKRRPGPNLALRLRDRQEAVLRFVSDPSGPCTPNTADKDLRRRQLRRQISGGFRSAPGARAGASLRSLLATARQQGLPRSEAQLPGPDALPARLQA